MSQKNILPFLLILILSSLVACGGSDGQSSGDKETTEECKDKEAKEEIVKACVIGNNPLEEGQSCTILDVKYTCYLNRVSGGGISSKVIDISGTVIYCTLNPPKVTLK